MFQIKRKREEMKVIRKKYVIYNSVKISIIKERNISEKLKLKENF